MRSRSFVALVCALCTAGAVSCSDDDGGAPGGGGTSQLPLNPMGGTGGVGGSANNGGAGGGSSGSSQGGSANNVGGASNGGASGAGMAGSSMTAAGAGGDEPDAGGGEPDAGGGEPPDDETVNFSEIFPILRDNCAGCHGNPNGGLPALAQANEDAAYEEAEAIADEIAGRVDGSGGNIMPANCGPGPGQGNCLSLTEVEAIQTWFDDGALR